MASCRSGRRHRFDAADLFPQPSMRGGAEGSGAPKGNRNALKHGTFTKEALSERTELRQRIRESEDLLRTLKESDR